MKIAVAPTVIALEVLMFRRLPPVRIIASVLVVCAGIGVATVTDSQMASNVLGIAVGVGATVMTALYQIWAGSKQKELKASSMQLLHAYTPQAALMLGILVPLCEPMGFSAAHRTKGTLLGYHLTPASAAAILLSAVLGLLVSLSTFLVIGATSSLTYNVVGHLKTVIILTGGCMFFGDTMPAKKFAGVCIAMLGIIWYTQMKLSAASAGPASAAASAAAAAGDAAAAAALQQQMRSPLLPLTNGTAHGAAAPPVSVKSVYTVSAARNRGVGGGGGGAGGAGGSASPSRANGHHSKRQQ